jgi:hypothetical protein
MSDETRQAQEKAPIHENHYCCEPGFGKWGGFGFARSKEIEYRWWCWEHYPQRDIGWDKPILANEYDNGLHRRIGAGSKRGQTKVSDQSPT